MCEAGLEWDSRYVDSIAKGEGSDMVKLSYDIEDKLRIVLHKAGSLIGGNLSIILSELKPKLAILFLCGYVPSMSTVLNIPSMKALKAFGKSA